jgi:hypothetical protein
LEHPELRHAARFLALSFEAVVDIVPMQHELQADFFEICSDPERRTYGAFGLPRVDTLALVARRTLFFYLRQALRGRVQRGVGSDIHQMGGNFVLDRAGNVRFTHVSAEPADRPEARAMLQELARWS